MVNPGDIIPYLSMCQLEAVSLQRGMNFHLNSRDYSVILMSLRPGAPYKDRIEDGGRTLIYEGHDIQKNWTNLDPKGTDQPFTTPNGTLTQNGLFYQAACKYKKSQLSPEPVRVYENVRPGIWVYNGLFKLVDAWKEISNGRNVYKFKLELTTSPLVDTTNHDLDHNRIIPARVKLEVWQRDKGCCTKCGSKDNLHFDHLIPYSKGGSSLVAENIQLLCARHNLAKHDKIEY